jgi:putative tryptophan/tyrosine transport system substrate-binding protein
MRRRQFIAGLGSAAAWPVAARAQQRKLRRVGALMPQAESDPEQQSWTTVFATRLRELGWTQGENVQIDYRWGAAADLPAMIAETLRSLSKVTH